MPETSLLLTNRSEEDTGSLLTVVFRTEDLYDFHTNEHVRDEGHVLEQKNIILKG